MVIRNAKFQTELQTLKTNLFHILSSWCDVAVTCCLLLTFDKVGELEKVISAAASNPAYELNDAEILKRRSWISTARNQVLFNRALLREGCQNI